jgi:trans-aconitate methyltransferase
VDIERRLSFGSVAELYDSSRPSYPDALVDDALAYAPARDDGPVRVVEVGAGTGKATVLFAARGASILAIEPDPEMAAIARRNCERFPDVTLLGTEFEGWEVGERQFDLLISAQAWHWISAEVRMAKSREALVDGGAMALFWNRPIWDSCELADALRAAYTETVPEFGEMPGPMHPGHTAPLSSWGAYGEDLDTAHGFEPEPVRVYHWRSEYTSGEYVRLLQTHSDHIVLPDTQRAALFEAIQGAINAAGGMIELTHRTHLWLARRI